MVGAFAVACIGPLRRIALKGKKSPVRLLAWSNAFLVAGLIGIYLISWGVTFPQHLKEGFWSAVVIATFLNYGISYCGAKALTYEQGEVTLVAPLAAMTPGLLTLMAVTLGELPGSRGIVGLCFLSVSSWILLTQNAKTWRDYFRPFAQLRLLLSYRTLAEQGKQRTIVVGLALATAALGSLSMLFVGLYVRRGGDLQGLWLAVIVLWSSLTLAFFIQHRLEGKTGDRSEWRGDEKKFFLVAVLGAVMIITATYVEIPIFGKTFIAYVGTLNRVGILFSVLLVWGLSKIGKLKAIFGEQDLHKRALAVTLVVIGVLLISSENIPERLTNKLILFGI